MAKTKSVKPDKATKSGKDKEIKPLSSVKEGAVTKPSQTPKSKSKDLAEQAVAKYEKEGKKSKKAKKEPTPVPSSSEESGTDEEDSASSASSDEESDVEDVKPKPAVNTNGTKANGAAKAAAAASDEDSESSDSSVSSDDEGANPKPTTTTTVAGAKIGSDSEDDDESSDESSEGPNANPNDVEDSEEDSEDSEDEVEGAVDAKKLNGKLKAVASNEVSSDEEDSDDAGSSSSTSEGSSSDESDESDEENAEETAPASKKRKAEAETTPVQKKAKTDPGLDDQAKKNLFVGQLSFNVDEEWLTREFEEYGELARVKVMADRDTGRSRGFGYVEYVNAEDGVKAQEAMHGKDIDGRSINVDFSKPKPDANAPRQERQKAYGDNPSPPSDTIFVANLPFEVTEDAVGEAFQKHGNILGIRLPTDVNSGAPKGFGYVQFGSVDEAKVAFENMAGAVIMGRPIRLDYSTPRPPRDDSFGGRGGRGGGGRGRGGFDRGGGRGRGRGGFDRGGGRGGRGGSTNRGGFGDFKGQKKTF